MWSLESAKSNGHLFSEYLDIVAFTLPVFLSAVLAPFLYEFVPSDEIPLWGYLLVVVFSDVSHVWTTLFRTHFNSEENKRRPALYNQVPILLLVVQFFVHLFFGERVFWTGIGYLAIYHFIKQQYGILMIAQCREKNFRTAMRDKWVLYALSLSPIALWHFDSSRQFDWFNRDDPFFVIPSSVSQFVSERILWSMGEVDITLLRIGYGAWLLIWGVFVTLIWSDYHYCKAQRKTFPVMRTLLLLYSGVTWSAGVLVGHKMIALTFLNLYHAVPSFLIVFCSSMNYWKCKRARSPSLGASISDKIGRIFSGSTNRFPLFLALLMLCGLVEEILWEVLVWRDYIGDDYLTSISAFVKKPLILSAITSILILPQTSHYVLDMFIWKMRRRPDGGEENPGLKRYLALE